MPAKVFNFTGLTGGLYASANIFDGPRGTTPRISNLLYTRRGGLQTVDGSQVQITPVAPPTPPMMFLIRYNPAGIVGPVPKFFALTLDPSKNSNVYDITTSPYASGLFGGPYANAGPTVSAVQFSDSMVFAFGLNVPPYIYNPLQSSSLVQIANTFQANTSYPPWTPSTQYTIGNKVLGSVGATSYIWRCIHGGQSGATAPPWTSGYKSQVADSTSSTSGSAVIWINEGPAAAGAPPGAAFVFNHLNSVWIWGTAAVYSNTGANQNIDGPDSLRMSTIGNPTSWDPSNQSFIGIGDGQMPMGGGVWTELEVGISANPQLILYKTYDTYSAIGSFPVPNISISKIPDGVGCAAPLTNQVVPGIGMMRLSFYGVAVFNGTRDIVDQFTDPIRPYLFAIGTDVAGNQITLVDWSNIQKSIAVQTVNPPGYLLLCPLVGQASPWLSRGFFFDRLLRAWTVIDLPPTLQVAGGLLDIATMNTQAPTTLLSGYSDGIVRRVFGGDEFWDSDPPGTPILWDFHYPVVGAPDNPLYYRRGLLQATVVGTTANITAVHLHIQDQNGLQGVTMPNLEIDAQQLSQAIDIDATALGGMIFHLFGQGRMLAQGLSVQYQSKPPSRLPTFT